MKHPARHAGSRPPGAPGRRRGVLPGRVRRLWRSGRPPRRGGDWAQAGGPLDQLEEPERGELEPAGGSRPAACRQEAGRVRGGHAPAAGGTGAGGTRACWRISTSCMPTGGWPSSWRTCPGGWRNRSGGNSSLLEDLDQLHADRRLAEFVEDMPRRLETVIGALRVLTGDTPKTPKPSQDAVVDRGARAPAAEGGGPAPEPALM